MALARGGGVLPVIAPKNSLRSCNYEGSRGKQRHVAAVVEVYKISGSRLQFHQRNRPNLLESDADITRFSENSDGLSSSTADVARAAWSFFA